MAELTDHPFHQQVLSLREAEISPPFEWGGGIHIIQVLERKEPRSKRHDELSAQLSQALLEQANVTVYDLTLQALFQEESEIGVP